MQVPSGRVFGDLDLQIMRLSAKYNFVRTSAEPFTLKSGVKSNVYVYVSGRDDLTDHPDLEWLVGRKIASLVLQNALERGDLKKQCLIGLPTAGTALAQAAAMVNWSCQRLFVGANEEPRIIHRIMREALKTHGAHPDWVNGKPQPDSHTYWGVDNVATDGGTKMEAREHFRESGYPEVMPAFIWIDRQQGAIVRLKRAGFSVIVVAYELLDVTFALGELGFWPKEIVRSVEVEIKAHQLIK